MSDDKRFIAGVNSDVRKAPVRVAFVTRRTSAQVPAVGEEKVQSFPEVLFRAAIAVEALAIVLVLISLFFNAPLEGLANPTVTPNPAKAPWYFLGLQELLHYFPPIVGGVLIPTLVVIALVVIPYFNINIQAEGFWVFDRARKIRILSVAVVVLCAFLAWFEVYAVLIPTVLIAVVMFLEANASPQSAGIPRWLHAKPLPFWIMSWFLTSAIILTAIGTFFRGAGWAWVWPWGAQ